MQPLPSSVFPCAVDVVSVNGEGRQRTIAAAASTNAFFSLQIHAMEGMLPTPVKGFQGKEAFSEQDWF